MVELLITARSFGFASPQGISLLEDMKELHIQRPFHDHAFDQDEMCNLISGKDILVVGTDSCSKGVDNGQTILWGTVPAAAPGQLAALIE